MLDVNPEEVAVEMLKEALPGFKAQIVEGRNMLGIHGALPIALEVSREMIWYPIHRPAYVEPPITRAFFDALETDAMREARLAKQREALRRELEPVVEHIADGIRRFAIDAVGLEPVIAERERRAHMRGAEEGHKQGRREGLAEGRAEAIREFAEAMRGLGLRFDDE